MLKTANNSNRVFVKIITREQSAHAHIYSNRGNVIHQHTHMYLTQCVCVCVREK